jgi:WXXGXW repeat (2 copies)
MQLKNALGSLALAASLAAGAGGCLVTAHGHVGAPVAVVEVDEEPPPPRVVHWEVRPGFVYIQGRWTRSGGRWVWRDGYYERERAGYNYEPGRWERRGNRHVWVEGSWRAGARSGPAVRDHREPPRREEHREGPVVRDHR